MIQDKRFRGGFWDFFSIPEVTNNYFDLIFLELLSKKR